MAKIPKSHFYVILFILMSSIFNPLYYNYLIVIYIIYNCFTTVINSILFIWLYLNKVAILWIEPRVPRNLMLYQLGYVGNMKLE